MMACYKVLCWLHYFLIFYTSDLLGLAARKFIYTDDITLIKQSEDFNTCEKALDNYLKEMDKVFLKSGG